MDLAKTQEDISATVGKLDNLRVAEKAANVRSTVLETNLLTDA